MVVLMQLRREQEVMVFGVVQSLIRLLSVLLHLIDVVPAVSSSSPPMRRVVLIYRLLIEWEVLRRTLMRKGEWGHLSLLLRLEVACHRGVVFI